MNAKISQTIRVLQNENKNKRKHFFPEMKSIYNAVPDTLEELELEEFFEYDIEEIGQRHYRVTFKEKENGNNKVVIEVIYLYGIVIRDNSALLDDNAWSEWIESEIVDRHVVSRAMAETIHELLAITIDDDHFDSDDDESIVSQASTLPPSPIPLA